MNSRSRALARQLGNMSHRVLVGVTVCGQVIKDGNARDEAAIGLAIDHTAWTVGGNLLLSGSLAERG